MIEALALVVAQAASGAWSVGRPPECAGAQGRATNTWERAKSPELRRYCDLVASAASKLAGTAAMAQAALDVALEADRAYPGHAAARVLQGRALAALGKFDDAYAALREAKARDERILEDPPAMLAWARVLARTGHLDDAAEAYRGLLPRAGALSSSDRVAAAIEAGLVEMAQGPSGLDDAAAALREAMRGAQDETEPVAVLALALALDRRGDRQQARALLSDRTHGDPRVALAAARAKEVISVTPAEAPALVAIGLELTDPAAARQAWEEYAAHGPPGPWAEHARARIRALPSGQAPRGRTER